MLVSWDDISEFEQEIGRDTVHFGHFWLRKVATRSLQLFKHFFRLFLILEPNVFIEQEAERSEDVWVIVDESVEQSD